MSGWLVGGSLLNKSTRDGAFRDYAIDRMSRLWIVLVPTFILILAIGMLTARIDPHVASFAAGNDYSATALVGNLVGLQKITVPTFGGNFPLWSLSNETWYYVLFPLLVIAMGTKSTLYRAGATVAAAGLAWWLNGPILLYFGIWLLGAAGSRIELHTDALTRWILALAFAAVAIFLRMKGKNDDLGIASFFPDLLFSILFILFLTSMQVRLTSGRRITTIAKRTAKFFANFSFTLYVVHVPLIGLATFQFSYLAHNRLEPNNPSHLLAYVGLFGAIVAVAYVFHLPFEANTQRLRTWLKSVSLRARSVV